MHSGLNQYMKMIHDLLIFQVESGASPYSSEHGLVVRSFVYLFQLIHERPECHFILKASFLEIYNEKVRNIHNIHYFLTAYLASGKQRPKKNHIPRSWHAFLSHSNLCILFDFGYFLFRYPIDRRLQNMSMVLSIGAQRITRCTRISYNIKI